jgi:hypothetical protein
MKDRLKITGAVEIVLTDENGYPVDTRLINNLVVNSGLDFIGSRMLDNTTSVMSFMGLGSDNTASTSTDTDLGALVGDREELTTAVYSFTQSEAKITYRATFEAGDATGDLSEAAIFNSSTGGTMLCRTTFDTLTKPAESELSVTWVISLSVS